MIKLGFKPSQSGSRSLLPTMVYTASQRVHAEWKSAVYYDFFYGGSFCARGFVYIILLNSYSSLVRSVLLSLFYRWWHWVSKGLSKLTKVIQHLRGHRRGKQCTSDFFTHLTTSVLLRTLNAHYAGFPSSQTWEGEASQLMPSSFLSCFRPGGLYALSLTL